MFGFTYVIYNLKYDHYDHYDENKSSHRYPNAAWRT